MDCVSLHLMQRATGVKTNYFDSDSLSHLAPTLTLPCVSKRGEMLSPWSPDHQCTGQAHKQGVDPLNEGTSLFGAVCATTSLSAAMSPDWSAISPVDDDAEADAVDAALVLSC